MLGLLSTIGTRKMFETTPSTSNCIVATVTSCSLGWDRRNGGLPPEPSRNSSLVGMMKLVCSFDEKSIAARISRFLFSNPLTVDEEFRSEAEWVLEEAKALEAFIDGALRRKDVAAE